MRLLHYLPFCSDTEREECLRLYPWWGIGCRHYGVKVKVEMAKKCRSLLLVIKEVMPLAGEFQDIKLTGIQ